MARTMERTVSRSTWNHIPELDCARRYATQLPQEEALGRMLNGAFQHDSNVNNPVYGLGEPVYPSTEWFRSHGEGGHDSADLRGLLYQVGITRPPEYLVMKIPRYGLEEWSATVSIFDGHRLLSTHKSPAFRSTPKEAMADAAWKAITALSHDYCHHLSFNCYGYFPRQERGSQKGYPCRSCDLLYLGSMWITSKSLS